MALLVRCFVFVVSVFASVAGPAFAATIWTEYRAIVEISPSGAGAVFMLEGAKLAPSSSCNNLFRIDGNDPNGASLLTSLSSAAAEERKVSVAYAGATTACEVLVLDVRRE